MDDLISIIVPVYNTEKYLDRCITSLINQTYKNIEIIIINDGSTDSSLEICQKYTDDKRVYIYSKDNAGVSEARNYGIKKTSGKYILFVDSDDWIESDMCEEMLKLSQGKDLDIVFCSYVKNYANKEVNKFIIETNDDTIFYDAKATKDILLRRIVGLNGKELAHPEHMDSLVTVWGKLYKKEIIQNIQFVDIKIIGNEDALYNIMAFNNANSTAYINKCYYHYWKSNQSSLTKSTEFTHFYRWKKMFEYIEKYLTNNNIYDEYSESFYNRIALSVIGLGLSAIKTNIPYSQKINNLKILLNDDKIHYSLKRLDKSFFDLKWKIFFYLAEHKRIYMLSILLIIILKIVT